ncbi:helix-turn-helix transcriptional regulator [Cytobacillus sp. FSL K6-0129]|uniref:helix-turn-helix transcriptional regulator n=1 Tax=Cytobacillus sp. FSL K6-0129 TaxID=2921421 RepID=UPI0030FB5E7C
MPIHNRLKELRHDHRMNQTEFAAYLEISHGQYNRYERNSTQPSLEVALKISKKLGCAVNDIFLIVDKPSAT